ncbi:MAG: hypothetical protein IPK83_23615 [Planctomycetes bacterium]|jgi:hypothetical protein|nr:hypothetical protein [Planctomycetota bacterium]
MADTTREHMLESIIVCLCEAGKIARGKLYRFKIKIGWHQCTAISGTKDKGYICCTRHNWHFGKHIDYSGREVNGRRIGFHKWTNHIFDD